VGGGPCTIALTHITHNNNNKNNNNNSKKRKKCFEFTLLVTYRPLTPHAHRETAPGLAFFETILGGFSQVQDTACFVISGLG
jgi:actin-related protein